MMMTLRMKPTPRMMSIRRSPSEPEISPQPAGYCFLLLLIKTPFASLIRSATLRRSAQSPNRSSTAPTLKRPHSSRGFHLPPSLWNPSGHRQPATARSPPPRQLARDRNRAPEPLKPVSPGRSRSPPQAAEQLHTCAQPPPSASKAGILRAGVGSGPLHAPATYSPSPHRVPASSRPPPPDPPPSSVPPPASPPAPHSAAPATRSSPPPGLWQRRNRLLLAQSGASAWARSTQHRAEHLLARPDPSGRPQLQPIHPARPPASLPLPLPSHPPRSSRNSRTRPRAPGISPVRFRALPHVCSLSAILPLDMKSPASRDASACAAPTPSTLHPAPCNL